MDHFIPWAVLDIWVGRFGCSCGPFWILPWAVLDISKICYGLVSDTANKSATSLQQVAVMEFGKRHDTTHRTDFCPRHLVTDLLRICRLCCRLVTDLLWTCHGEVAKLLRTCYGETDV